MKSEKRKVKGKFSGNRIPVSTKPTKIIYPAKGKGSYDRRKSKNHVQGEG